MRLPADSQASSRKPKFVKPTVPDVVPSTWPAAIPPEWIERDISLLQSQTSTSQSPTYIPWDTQVSPWVTLSLTCLNFVSTTPGLHAKLSSTHPRPSVPGLRLTGRRRVCSGGGRRRGRSALRHPPGHADRLPDEEEGRGILPGRRAQALAHRKLLQQKQGVLCVNVLFVAVLTGMRVSVCASEGGRFVN